MTTPEELSLAHSLADPIKSVRDQALRGLGVFVRSSSEVSDLEMLKFWKGLYYCLWLSDKVPVQQELVASLARLVHECPSEERVCQFLKCFFQTMMREWACLDQYRVNKFYSLLRMVLRQTLHYLHQRRWPRLSVETIFRVLCEEVLSKTPNGPRLHYADIYLAELFEVTKGEVVTGNMLTLLSPWLLLLSADKSADSSFKDRIAEKVFVKFATDRAVECGGDGGGGVFLKCRSGAVQLAIFNAASADNTLELNRKRLYEIHKAFQKTTGEDFATEQEDDLNTASTEQELEGAAKKRKTEKEDSQQKRRKKHIVGQ